MDDNDVIKLFDKINLNTMIEIYSSEKEEKKLNKKHFINSSVYKAGLRFLGSGCKYTNKATTLIALKFPNGDIDSKIGVCTDLVVRSMRSIDIDLQSLLYNDIKNFPDYYKSVKKANYHIDHRRTRTLKLWFDKNTSRISSAYDKNNCLPGDIILFDTGINNGTIYDHIGIVSPNKSEGRYLVINHWTIGYEVEEMDLLIGTYPETVGHYRFNHIYDYAANPNVK